MMIDVGANVDCKPHNLQQFAVMGEIYFRSIFGKPRPQRRAALDRRRGNQGQRADVPGVSPAEVLPINFVGNVEGRDLYNGNADVIICDGFVGNVALKVSEGVAQTVRYMLRESLKVDDCLPGRIDSGAQRLQGLQEAPGLF